MTEIKLQDLTNEQLTELKNQIERERDRRENARYKELITNFKIALGALAKEFPYNTCFDDSTGEDITWVELYGDTDWFNW